MSRISRRARRPRPNIPPGARRLTPTAKLTLTPTAGLSPLRPLPRPYGSRG
ncbi:MULTISPECIES: hypothetical protein [unclassified Actinomyces]|uniref:hypothetical protein n=1 Tax=unclassified Actinomyces TaxID=2609248 RepID=UPI00131EEDD2|nr:MULTISPECIES: hypothetical protein [unclassified Actinomyces]